MTHTLAFKSLSALARAFSVLRGFPQMLMSLCANRLFVMYEKCYIFRGSSETYPLQVQHRRIKEARMLLLTNNNKCECVFFARISAFFYSAHSSSLVFSVCRFLLFSLSPSPPSIPHSVHFFSISLKCFSAPNMDCHCEHET